MVCLFKPQLSSVGEKVNKTLIINVYINHLNLKKWMQQLLKKDLFAVELEQGKEYYWCACGKSKNQPYCDGSHQGSEFSPLAFTAEESKTAYLCGCKHSKNAPYCDGTHTKL